MAIETWTTKPLPTDVILCDLPALAELVPYCRLHDDCRNDEGVARACAAEAHRELREAGGTIAGWLEAGYAPRLHLGYQDEHLGRHVRVRRCEGRVKQTGYASVQVMSDIWESFNHAWTVEPASWADRPRTGVHVDWTTGETHSVREPLRARYAAAGFPTSAVFEADAPEELLAQERAAFEAYEAKQAAERAAEEAKIPRKGRRVRVVRGRKVPQGTEGLVFWEGQTTYGLRLGIKTDAGETVWTTANNCLAIAPAADELPLPEGTPEVRRGQRVRLASGAEGEVFWMRGRRIGVKATRNAEPVWANVTDVAEVLAA